MRRGFVLAALTAVVCLAQGQAPDNQGFVNQRLLRADFLRNRLHMRPLVNPPRVTLTPTCSIPLIERIPVPKNIDRQMILPRAGKSVDSKMAIDPFAGCPAK